MAAKYRVLIVDDQREIRFILRSGLQSLVEADIQITDVPSGEEAILVISRQPIDLLITDVRLPGISGLELRERAVIRNPGLKVILMTGLPEPRLRREVEKAGADAFFFKPFDLTAFLETVKVCLGLNILPPSQGADQKPQTLADRLSILHQELGASAVLLLNEEGRIVAETSQLEEFADDSPKLTAVSALFSAATKVDHLIGATIKDWMVFKGKEHDLVLTHVGSTLGLLVILPDSALGDQQLPIMMASLHAAVKDLTAILDQMGVALPAEASVQEAPPPSEPKPEEVDISAVLPELDAIFNQAPKKSKAKDADSFWKELSDSSTEEVRRADAISYEQARKLGLAPKE
jgi:CheY-like chemotaxis protein